MTRASKILIPGRRKGQASERRGLPPPGVPIWRGQAPPLAVSFAPLDAVATRAGSSSVGGSELVSRGGRLRLRQNFTAAGRNSGEIAFAPGRNFLQRLWFHVVTVWGGIQLADRPVSPVLPYCPD